MIKNFAKSEDLELLKDLELSKKTKILKFFSNIFWKSAQISGVVVSFLNDIVKSHLNRKVKEQKSRRSRFEMNPLEFLSRFL